MRTLRKTAAAAFAVAAVAALALGAVGCDDGCPKGQHQVVSGYSHHYVPGSYSHVGKTTVYHPGHTATTTNYECRPK